MNGGLIIALVAAMCSAVSRHYSLPAVGPAPEEPAAKDAAVHELERMYEVEL